MFRAVPEVACLCDIGQSFRSRQQIFFNTDYIFAFWAVHFIFSAGNYSQHKQYLSDQVFRSASKMHLDCCSQRKTHFLMEQMELQMKTRAGDRGEASSLVFQSPITLDFASSMWSGFCCRHKLEIILIKYLYRVCWIGSNHSCISSLKGELQLILLLIMLLCKLVKVEKPSRF